MPGYSGTPLPKKLGIKDGSRTRLVAIPPDVRAELKPSLARCEMHAKGKGPLDFGMVFAKSRAELITQFNEIAEILASAGMIWAIWPKKSSGVSTDLDENKVRDIGLAVGLVDVKVCAVTDVWSGLKFVRRVKDR